MAFPQYGSPSPTGPNQDKVPAGGLGEMMQKILGGMKPPGGAGPQGGPGAPPSAPPGVPGIPGAPGMMPGAPAMPGPGGPMQSAGMEGGMTPEEHAAILEQIKGELMKSIAGQSGQQDSIFTASSGLSRYRPMGNPSFPNLPPQAVGAPPAPPQDAAFPPGMTPAGLGTYRATGNPMPGMGIPPRPPLR